MVISLLGGRAIAQEHAELPEVVGAGSTGSANAIERWRADVARFGLRVSYQAFGSTQGRVLFAQNQVDFGVSEVPYGPGDAFSATPDTACGEGGSRVNGRCLVYVPVVATGLALMYNVRDGAGGFVTDLRLSPATIAKIFTGTIWNWSDPAITADNGGNPLPSQQINVVVRSDGAGTTANFTDWLSKMPGAREVWNTWTACRATPNVTSRFPAQQFAQKREDCGDPADRAVNITPAAGSDGAANVVSNSATGEFSITYVEMSYALERSRPVAAVRNASGAFVVPTAANVTKALERARVDAATRTAVLDDVYVNSDPNAYPISSYGYLIAPTTGFDPAKGESIARFIHYFACRGQDSMGALGYSQLPPVLVRLAFDAAAQIPGAPPAPALTYESCPNPTLAGTQFEMEAAGCTIVGTEGADALRGTAGDDVICALGGDDTVDGGAGNDTIIGGPGRDTVAGGTGRDRILGAYLTTPDGDTGDTIHGGPGNDEIVAGPGSDVVYGGDGDDTVNGDAGSDRVFGDAGRDTLRGGGGNDELHGGDDDLDGGDGTDSCDVTYGLDAQASCEGIPSPG